MVDTCQLTGEADMKLAGDFAAGAKNRRSDTTGYSARQRVFGKSERFPGSVIDALQDGENPMKWTQAGAILCYAVRPS